MKKTLHIGLIIVLGCVFNTATAQSPQQIEQGILAHLKHIQYWRFEYSPEDTVFKTKVNPEDSLVAANTMLMNYLLKVCDKNAELLKYSFKLPENSDMKIVTSDNGKLRTYSWDTHQSTDAHLYTTVYQYETSKGVKATNNVFANDAKGRLFQQINTYSNVYLAVSSDIAAENNVTKTILGLSIAGDKLTVNDVFVIDGNAQPSLSYTYNYSSNYDFKKMKEEYAVKFDKGKLLVPEVEDYKMTGKYTLYNFDGTKFVLDKNVK